MNENSAENEIQSQNARGMQAWPWGQIILGLGVVACLCTALFLHAGMLSLRMETQTLAREMAAVRQTLSVSDVSHTQNLADMRAALDATKKETRSSVESTRLEARRAARAIVSGVTSTSKELAQKQAEQAEQAKAMEMQLSEVRNEAREASTKLIDVTSQVGLVKTDVASTRGDLDRTISELRRTTGDMGVMSGLIATNGRELQALRELGERDYYEFTLSKVNTLQKIGDIQVVVKKTDPKRNRYTLQIVADDKRVEKKDRNVNEPVQFYVTSKARQPYELVVNEVRKAQIVGYLAVPKLKMARRGEGD